MRALLLSIILVAGLPLGASAQITEMTASWKDGTTWSGRASGLYGVLT